MTENKKHKKSPIKDLPVRMPGQFLRERIDYLVDEGLMPWVTIAVCMIIFAFLEWIAVFFHTPRSPWPFTIIAVLLTMVAGVKMWRTKEKIKPLRLGQTGEDLVTYDGEIIKVNGFHSLTVIPWSRPRQKPDGCKI